MTEFKKFANKIKQQFDIVQQGYLFVSSVTGDQLWELYIKSFRPEDDPPFRDTKSSQHNCNLDKSFIRRYGNVVSINENYEIVTMWDVELDPTDIYYNSCKAMAEVLKNASIQNMFCETYDELNSLNYQKVNKSLELFRLGIETNHKVYTEEEANKFGVVEAGKSYQFNHFFVDLKKEFVDFSKKSQASIQGTFKASKDVFLRGMEEIPIDTLYLVKDLINQGSLLDGTAHLHKIEGMLPLKMEFDNIAIDKKDNWAWVHSYNLPFAKFRNELIGTLCVELSEGVELNQACQKWNKRVDPANYMKAKAPITANQIKQAEDFVKENGYEESFNRRFATINDINVNEILHSNIGDGIVKTASIFDSVKPSRSTRHKRSQFDTVEKVHIDKFMKDILPSSTSIEAFFENRMEGNLVSLTTANDVNSKNIFKWNNNFSWTYKGNLAGKSMIKEAVKTAGGKIDGVLRFSIMWADGDGDNSDLDAHCIEPNKNEIYYGRKISRYTDGHLDIDITQPNGRLAVENITYPYLQKMQNGDYHFFVSPFTARGSKGFKAEIEFNGELFQYEYSKPVEADIQVAVVTLKDGQFSITHDLPENNVTKEIWGLETNQFHKVNLVSLSPNHWGSNNVGNKHYLFMLQNCKSDQALRSFHNENLNSDLLEHRKTLEVLGTMNTLEPANQQLCGLGFNSTVPEELILKIEGTHKRMIKVVF